MDDHSLQLRYLCTRPLPAAKHIFGIDAVFAQTPDHAVAHLVSRDLGNKGRIQSKIGQRNRHVGFAA